MSVDAQESGQSPGGFLQWVERVGNKIPNPFLLFVYLIAVLMIASAVISWLNVTAVKSFTLKIC